MVIGLKADGYILVEPSLHPSGKTCEWEASSNPLEGCVPSPLPGWIADMSRQQAAPMPADQVRQFAGVRPLADAEVAEIVAALAMIPAVERETWLHVGMALHKDVGGALGYELWCTWSQRCADKFDPQDQLRVWRSFTRKPMGQAVQLGTVFDLAYKHGFCRPKPSLVLVAPAPVGEVDPRTMNTTPELVAGPRVQLQAMPVQGLNDLARWIFDSSPNAHGLLAQAAALALVATCAGRRYVSEFGDPANVFIGLITPTTSQARSMLTAAESALVDINLHRLVRSQRMGSAQQVYASFVRSSSVLYAADDWGDQLSAAKRQPSGLLSIAHGALAGRVHAAKNIALDNWAEIGLKRPDTQQSHMPTLYQPGLTLLAAISEPQLRQVFKRQELGRGALDCMLFIPALDMAGWTDRSVTAATLIPPSVAARLRELRGLPASTAEEPEPEIDSVLIGPTPTTMRQLCVAMAAFCDPVNPLVHPEMLAWCERLVRECLDVTLTEVAMLAGDDDDKPDAGDKLMEFLVRTGPDGAAMRDLHKLCWAYKRLSTDDRAKLLGRLYEDDDITDMPTPRGKRIVARQFVVERAVVVTKAAP